MHSAEHSSLARVGVIVLNEAGADSNLGEMILTPDFGKKAAFVIDSPWAKLKQSVERK